MLTSNDKYKMVELYAYENFIKLFIFMGNKLFFHLHMCDATIHSTSHIMHKFALRNFSTAYDVCVCKFDVENFYTGTIDSSD